MLHLHTLIGALLLQSAMSLNESNVVYLVIRHPNGADESVIFRKPYWDFYQFNDGGLAAWNGKTLIDLSQLPAIRSYTTIRGQ
jgi:hypothetical protein